MPAAAAASGAGRWAAAVEKLADYLLNPEKIKDLINEEDIYQLFITKFKKLI